MVDGRREDASEDTDEYAPIQTLSTCYHGVMGKLVKEGWSRLDMLLEEHGEESFLQGICGRVAEGESPDVVSRSMGVPWLVVRKWMEDDGRRYGLLELAKRCWADRLVWSAVSAARDAGVDDVSVCRLRADTYLKVAAKADRGSWGDAKEDRGAGITLVIDRSCGGTVQVEGGVLRIGIEEGAGTHIKDIPVEFGECEQ